MGRKQQGESGRWGKLGRSGEIWHNRWEGGGWVESSRANLVDGTNSAGGEEMEGRLNQAGGADQVDGANTVSGVNQAG